MLGTCTAVSPRLFCAQLVDLRRVHEAILSSAFGVDTGFQSSSFKCHWCTSDSPQPTIHEVIVQLGQMLNGSQHDCLERVLMSWNSSSSPFFLAVRSLAAGNGLVRAAPTAKEQALRVLNAQGLHAPGHLVRHVISLLVSSTSSHFQSTTTRSTTWTARPSQRRHCTPSTSSRTFTVDKQRQRTALARQLREWRKPAPHLSHR